MKVNKIEDRENPLLNRREIKFTVQYSGPTPRKADVRKQIISVLGSDAKLTVLDSLTQSFGKTEVAGYVKVYKDAESMKVEPEYRLKQNFEVKKKGSEKPEEKTKKGEEKPTAEKPEEKTKKGEEKPTAEKPEEEKPTEEETKEEPAGEKPEEKKEGEKPPVEDAPKEGSSDEKEGKAEAENRGKEK